MLFRSVIEYQLADWGNPSEWGEEMKKRVGAVIDRYDRQQRSASRLQKPRKKSWFSGWFDRE